MTIAQSRVMMKKGVDVSKLFDANVCVQMVESHASGLSGSFHEFKQEPRDVRREIFKKTKRMFEGIY